MFCPWEIQCCYCQLLSAKKKIIKLFWSWNASLTMFPWITLQDSTTFLSPRSYTTWLTKSKVNSIVFANITKLPLRGTVGWYEDDSHLVCFWFSVLDLNAFERQNKAEGLGMVTEEGTRKCDGRFLQHPHLIVKLKFGFNQNRILFLSRPLLALC